MLDQPYHPALPLRNGHIQTFLGSSSLRTCRPNPMQAVARAEILTSETGVRLLGWRPRQTAAPSKALVVLLHGWEGSADSTYMRRTGQSLHQRGYEVFRLNLRDHGSNHHLNRGIFFAPMINSARCLAFKSHSV